MNKGGRYLLKQAKTPKGKVILLVALIVVVGLLVTGIGGGILYYNHVLGLVGQAEYVEKNPSDEDIAAILGPGYLDNSNAPAPPAPTEEMDTEPVTEPFSPNLSETGKIINIMLVGQSYRAGEESRLADSMILATLNVETKTLTLTSFLRDMYIKLPNYKGHTCGHNKINTCYALGYAWGDTKGAMEMLDKLMLEQFGVNVDYNVEVDFNAFQEVINALGGIEVDLTEAEAKYLTEDNHNEGSFEAGTALLDGDSALAYARMRKSSADDSDFHRANRQRIVIGKVLEKCKSMSLTQLNNMLNKILPMIITDMPKEVITTYALNLLPILPELQMVSNQCPAEDTYSSQIIEIYGVNQGCIMPNVAKNKELLMAIAESDVMDTAE